MTASLLNGKIISTQIQEELKAWSQTLKLAGQRMPGLAVILLNGSLASAIYVENKRKACKRVGFQSYNFNLPSETTEADLLKLIEELNMNPEVDGILVQLPLPSHINTPKLIEAIRPDKDVDGFHPYNLGRLLTKHPVLRPCTPYGIIQLLTAYQLHVPGQHAVIVGASNIVGRPMALEFLMSGATVTVCHRLTTHLEQHVRMADILVVATGSRHCIHVDWLSAHQIIIDVGIHRLSDNSIQGDLDFEKAKQKVSWITPVPGGVGPMTIATLLQNTKQAYQLHQVVSK